MHVHPDLMLQRELAPVQSMPFVDGKMEGAGLVTSPSTAEETILTREYPLAHDCTNEPCYPTVFGEGMALYQKCKLLAKPE